MGLFSLNWFKSKKQEELQQLEIERQKLEIERVKLNLESERFYIDRNKREFLNPTPVCQNQAASTLINDVLDDIKPYINIKLINNILTIVLLDGSIITKNNANSDDFKKAREASSEEELLDMVSSKELVKERKEQEKEVEKIKNIQTGIKILDKFKDFKVEDNTVYMNGINRSVPQLLVEKFVEIFCEYYSENVGITTDEIDNMLLEDEEYQSLKKFWMKCCLNPNAQSAEDLYTFLSNHSFKIDKHGNFYAYRRVVSKSSSTDKTLVEFVGNTYNKIKAVWKKNPADYIVYKNEIGEFGFGKTANGEEVGNLKELYLDLPNMSSNSYTSAHTGTEDYKVGSVISMPRFEGNDDNSISCSKGFHAASQAYNYSGFGDTPILVIINPIDVLAVPLGEVGKLRTCRWFFATTLDVEEQFILDDEDFDVADLGDVFEEMCAKDLTNYVQNSFAEEVKRHTFNIPQITARELNLIVTSLDEMSQAISNRVKTV